MCASPASGTNTEIQSVSQPAPHSSPRCFEVPVEHAVVASPGAVGRRADDLQVQLPGERGHGEHGPAALAIRGAGPFVSLRRGRGAP